MPPSFQDLGDRYHVNVFDREYLRNGDETFLASIYRPQRRGGIPLLERYREIYQKYEPSDAR